MGIQAVTIDVPRDTVLRRYMSLEVFQKLLETRSLYFSCFLNFDDHLEGGISKNNFPSISNSWEIFDYTMARWPSADGNKDENSESIDFSEAKFQSLFGEQRKIDGEEYLKHVSSWLYASCWTDLTHECQAMWQLYGSSGSNCNHDNSCVECQKTVARSVCVVTTLGAIMDNLEINSDYNLIVRKVDYIDHRTSTFDEDELVTKPFFSKALHFSYENEVRFMLWPNRADIKFTYKFEESTVNTIKNVSLPIKDMNSFIGKIILSPLAVKTQKKIIAEHRSKFKSDLGLVESLANSKLRDDIDCLLQKYGLDIEVHDSDLNQAPTTDSYTSWP